MSSYSIEKDETIEISKNLSIGYLNESLWATTDIETGLKDAESKLQGIGVKDFKQADSCHWVIATQKMILVGKKLKK